VNLLTGMTTIGKAEHTCFSYQSNSGDGTVMDIMEEVDLFHVI
jgi:hypothetical protein